MQQAATTSGGLSGIFSSVNKWFLTWPGLAGTPFYVFFGNAVHNVYQADPAAPLSSILVDGSIDFYSTLGNAFMNGLVPVAELAAKSAFNTAVETFLPGSSLALDAGLEMMSF